MKMPINLISIMNHKKNSPFSYKIYSNMPFSIRI